MACAAAMRSSSTIVATERRVLLLIPALGPFDSTPSTLPPTPLKRNSLTVVVQIHEPKGLATATAMVTLVTIRALHGTITSWPLTAPSATDGPCSRR